MDRVCVVRRVRSIHEYIACDLSQVKLAIPIWHDNIVSDRHIVDKLPHRRRCSTRTMVCFVSRIAAFFQDLSHFVPIGDLFEPLCIGPAGHNEIVGQTNRLHLIPTTRRDAMDPSILQSDTLAHFQISAALRLALRSSTNNIRTHLAYLLQKKRRRERPPKNIHRYELVILRN